MMKSKNMWFLTVLLFALFSCGQNEYFATEIMRGGDGLYTERFSNEPITGAIYGDYGKEGKINKVYLGEMVNGKREGNWTTWQKNGQKRQEMFFQNNKLEGIVTNWYTNGYKKSERNFVAGVENGLRTEWYDTGEKKAEINFKDDLENGLKTTWHKNGQIEYECDMKNGYSNGKCPKYHEDGRVVEELKIDFRDAFQFPDEIKK